MFFYLRQILSQNDFIFLKRIYFYVVFFILSKILSFFTAPLAWILVLLAFGLRAGCPLRKKRRLILAFILFLLFSNGYIFKQTSKLIEYEPIALAEIDSSYACGIVLGGITSWDAGTQRIVFHGEADRLNQTVWLYKKGVIRKILISGGNANLFDKTQVEADFVKTYLTDLDIPSEDILTENKSKNTHQNAHFSAKLLNDSSMLNQKCLLITSNNHILRAKLCFEKAGVRCDIFPTSVNSASKPYLSELIVPNAKTLSDWSAFFHEIIGLATYKIMGYI